MLEWHPVLYGPACQCLAAAGRNSRQRGDAHCSARAEASPRTCHPPSRLLSVSHSNPSLISRPIRARIDLAALRHNYLVARRHAGAARAFAVVKADAYGHGLMRTVRALADLADGFALLDLADAVMLRDAGITQPIVLLEGIFAAGDVAVCAEYRLRPAIHCAEQVAMLRAAPPGVRLPVGLKVNSGMNRLGFRPEAVPAVLAELRALPAVESVLLMSHFADADGSRGVDEQYRRMAPLLVGFAGEVSLANSAAILRHAHTAHDWVRPGLMLYGGSPFADASAESLGLRPVMTLGSRIIAVQELAAGERVGYGGLFTATQPTRVGVVACGYGDGYPRHAPGGTPILVEGRRTQTIGRVSMDMLACDLSALPAAGVGSAVTLFGEGLPADEIAAAAGTLSYELFCALTKRVPVIECGGD